MDEQSSLSRFGLYPADEDLDEIRQILQAQTELERRRQGDGDTALMKLCCVQLFNNTEPEDVLRIWAAKSASSDADFAVDVELLCGAGIEETKAYLTLEGSAEAAAVLEYLKRWEETEGVDFSVDRHSSWYDTYYLR